MGHHTADWWVLVCKINNTGLSHNACIQKLFQLYSRTEVSIGLVVNLQQIPFLLFLNFGPLKKSPNKILFALTDIHLSFIIVSQDCGMSLTYITSTRCKLKRRVEGGFKFGISEWDKPFNQSLTPTYRLIIHIVLIINVLCQTESTFVTHFVLERRK